MIRSLYSGISGLRTHQVGLDVTANNIANVNTVAFKAGRATFKESMVQMLQGPSRPAGNQGGRNPMQVGLGVAVGSIDTLLRQGNFQTTGQITDLALEGRAYFAFSSGGATYYSRNGGLQMDSHGYLVSPTNGFRLQGKMANVNGVYDAGSVIGDIRIPWGDKAPAKATDYVALSCNLNSDSAALGTVTHTNRFLASAGVLSGINLNDVDERAGMSRARLTDLFDSYGNSLGIQEGDTLTFGVASPEVPAFRFVVERDPVTREIPTLGDFVEHLEAYLNGIQLPTVDGTTSNSMDERRESLATFMSTYTYGTPGGIRVSIDPATGGLSINNPITNLTDVNAVPGTVPEAASIVGLQVRSSRPTSNSYVANAFLFPRSIAPNALDGDIPTATDSTRSYTSPAILIPATGADLLGDLFDATGRSLEFTHGDRVTINGMVGGRSISGGPERREFILEYTSATTMSDLLEALQQAFSLPPTDGTIYNRESVYMKTSNDLVNDGIPVGAIVMRGQAEIAFGLTGISVIGRQADPNQELNPTRFNSNMTFTEVQTARNTGVWTTSDIVYDDSGAPHNIVMTFTHTGVPGEWLWNITTVGGDEVVLGGNRGRVTFALDGTPSAFTFDDGSNGFRFDPRNGAREVNIRIDAGEPGSRTGITQYHAESTTALTGQNGYTMGKLAEISIGEDGEIVGIYTNHTNKSIAQIYVAEFNNPAGMMKMGDSMFAVSGNSGEAAMYRPMVGSTTKVKPGALEMSNVELETEFTNMITIQRGYQASARVISTSDQMLQELVQLVR